MLIEERTLSFEEIAIRAGYEPDANGRFSLKPSDETAQMLTEAALILVGKWRPGMPALVLTLTGAGPIWGYLAIAEGLRSRVLALKYAAPNAAAILIWSRGL